MARFPGLRVFVLWRPLAVLGHVFHPEEELHSRRTHPDDCVRTGPDGLGHCAHHHLHQQVQLDSATTEAEMPDVDKADGQGVPPSHGADQDEGQGHGGGQSLKRPRKFKVRLPVFIKPYPNRLKIRTEMEQMESKRFVNSPSIT